MSAIRGMIKILRFDPSFVQDFEASPKGFWQSAAPAILYAPLYLYLMMIVYKQVGLFDNGVVVSFALAIEVLGYVASWLLFPLIAFFVMKHRDLHRRFFDVMVPYKWVDGLMLIYGVGILIGAVVIGLPTAMVQLLSIIVNVLQLANKYFVVKTVNVFNKPAAIGFIFMEIISVFLIRILVGSILGSYLI